MRKIEYARTIYGDLEKEAVRKVLESDYLSGGEQSVMFEKELAEWWGVRYALAVNSGSSANFLALQSLGLEEGSEVITPAGAAFPTTVSPIVYHRLIPVFVDIDMDNMCLDLDQVEQAISPSTKAIMFAHTLGFTPDMNRLMGIAMRHGLRVIEDCSDAMGSMFEGQKVGTFGDIATCSFYPAHHITTGGEGGAVLTNSSKLYMETHSIRDWGRDCFCRWGGAQPVCGDRFGNPPFDHRYYYTRLGMNLKLTEMQAAFGREQLRRVDGFIEQRRKNFARLAHHLGVEVNPEISPFAFPILHPRKNEVMMELSKRGIQTRALFAGNILAHPAYRDIKKRVIGDLHNSDKILQEAFFVGVGPHLNEDDMDYIAEQLKEVMG